MKKLRKFKDLTREEQNREMQGIAIFTLFVLYLMVTFFVLADMSTRIILALMK